MDWKREYHILMAHFAQLDENNKVLQVIVVSNEELLDNGVESEAKGIEFCQSLFGGTWIKTSYNTLGGVHTQGGTPLRKNYAGIGFTYDSVRDAFISPSPFPSWVLNEGCFWEAPVPMPIDDKRYTWDEETLAWVEV
jgi:hypothetical protein